VMNSMRYSGSGNTFGVKLSFNPLHL